LDLFNFLIADKVEIGAFGQESSNNAVVVLNSSSLFRAVGMGEIEGRPYAFGQHRVFKAVDN